VKLVVLDDHEGIKSMVGARWAAEVRGDLERSVLSYVPTSLTVEVAQAPKAIFKVSRQKTALAPAQE
jgi:hypothetical protein